MTFTRITSTTDPINGFNIIDPKYRPHVIEGDASNELTIYFETDATRRAYLDITVERPEEELSRTLSNPTDVYSN